MKSHSPNIRLQKVIADCGITSRRKAEQYILGGRVKVNGEKVTVLGTKVDPSLDVIEVDEQVVDPAAVDKYYLVMNKPRSYMTTVSDPEGRRTVMELCKGIKARLFPVGRLDYLSEGLLIMTNDGDMANIIMHPKYEISKVYEVKVFGRINAKILRDLRAGVEVEGELLKPQAVRVLEELPTKTWLEFRLQEGKNREIRKLCEAVGLTVDKLKRVAIGGFSVKGIAPGNFHLVSKHELLKTLGIDEKGRKIKDIHFISPKKTIKAKKLARRMPEKAKWADSEEFKRYRKEEYYKTLAIQKEHQKHLAEKEKQN